MVVEVTGYEICPHGVLITGGEWLRSGSKEMITGLLPQSSGSSPWASLFRLCDSYHTQNFTPARKAAQRLLGMSRDLRVTPRPSEGHSVLRLRHLGGATLP